MKKVIITGPTGAIGSAMCDILANYGCEVFAIIRIGSSNKKNIKEHNNIHIIECDLSDLMSLKALLPYNEFDAFYHLAWAGTIGAERNSPEIQMNNIKYTLDAVKIAKELNCKVFIGAGSQAEYGHFFKAADSQTVTKPFTFYGAAKLSSGQMSRVYANTLGIKHIWTRIFSVYGPNDDPNTLISYIISELLRGNSPDLTPCEQIWDYLYSYDAAQALILLAQKGQNNKTYCIGSSEEKPLKEYVSQINNIVNKNIMVNYAAKPYSEQQIMFLSANINDLKKDTGFEPKYSFEDGIKEILKFIGEKIA